MKRYIVFLLVCFCFSAIFSGLSFSQTPIEPTPNDEETPPVPSDDLLPGIAPGTDQAFSMGEVKPQSDILTKYQTAGLDVLDASVFGDHVDIDTGALSFTHIDVSLPGNSSLPVQIGRSLSPMSASWLVTSTDTLGFDNWDATIPHIRQKYAVENGPQLDRCTGELGGPQQTVKFGIGTLYRWQFWDGIQLSLGGQPIGLMKGGNINEFSGKGGRLVSKNADIVTCVPSIGPGLGEGFKLTQRDGTTYEFGKRVEYDVPSAQGDGSFFDLKMEVFFVTRIEDVHGNYVDYTYNGNRLSRIRANDSRQIDVTWSGGKISRVTANGRHWDYSYNADGLDRVTMPDNTFWDFSGTEAVTRDKTYQGCLDAYPDITVKHPAGAQATFEFDPVTNGRTNMPLFPTTNQPAVISECTVGHPESPKAFITTAVTKKRVTVPSGPTQTWTWSYQQDNGAYQSETQPSDLKTRTVTYPDGHQVKTYINRRFSWEEGNVEKIETLTSGSSAVRTQEYTYTLGHKIGSRMYAAAHSQSLGALYQIYQTEAEITQDSATYLTVNEFETDPNSSNYAYGAPERVTLTSSTAPGLSRINEFEYTHYKTPWILGLPKRTKRNSKIFDEHTYNSSTGLRLTSKQFGVQMASYLHYGDGTLRRVTDALGRITEYSNYKRGVPQTTVQAQGSSAQATTTLTVDNNGWVTNHTDPNGNSYAISYDDMGRMTSLNPPGSQWASTNVSYSSLGSGIVSTATRGNTRTTTTYDGYYRPILVKSEDLTGNASPRYVKTTYDSMGRTSFTSLPSGAPNPTAGVNTSYDALGRVTQTAETVAPFATTSTSYLSNNRVRVTDASGAQVTTTYRAFGAPATDEAMQVLDSGATVTMSRDIYGNIENINQSSGLNGKTINIDRKFYYDNRLRLCRHSAPEFGDELFAYDNENQLTMSSRGETSGTTCSSPSSSLRTSFSYDGMGRQTLVNFPAGTDDITRIYDANGNETRNLRGGIIWDYAYTELNAISQEKLVIDGNTFTFNYTRDQNGYVSTRSSPSGLLYSFDPNGFGEPTQLAAGGTNHIDNVTYHPNGMVASGVFANGQAFSQTLTTRQQPLRARTQKPGSYTATDLQYTYEVRGKVASITDHAQSGYNQVFTYNPLGRLLTASGNWGTGRFKYDGAGNIIEKRLGSRYVEMAYNANNQLDWVVDTANPTRTFTHDARGNVTNDGRYTYVYDRANQPTSVDIGPATLPSEYDGNLKRVKNVFRNNGGALRTVYTVYSRVSGTPIYRLYSTGLQFEFPEDIGPMSVWFLNGNFHSYRHLDHLGSVLAVTNTSGTSSNYREQYTPFGERLIETSNHNNPSYTGHARDMNTNLYYMQARYYDPVIGRFLSTDPIGYRDQINLYAYVHNDPINLIDPTGEYAEVTVDGNNIRVHFNFVVRTDFVSADQELSGRAGVSGSAIAGKLDRAVQGLNQLQVGGDYNVTFTHTTMLSNGEPPLRNYTAVQPVPGAAGSVYSPNHDTVVIGERSSPGTVGHEVLHGAGVADQYDSSFNPNPGFSEDNVMVNSQGTEIAGSQIEEIIASPFNEVSSCDGEVEC